MKFENISYKDIIDVYNNYMEEYNISKDEFSIRNYLVEFLISRYENFNYELSNSKIKFYLVDSFIVLDIYNETFEVHFINGEIYKRLLSIPNFILVLKFILSKISDKTEIQNIVSFIKNSFILVYVKNIKDLEKCLEI